MSIQGGLGPGLYRAQRVFSAAKYYKKVGDVGGKNGLTSSSLLLTIIATALFAFLAIRLRTYTDNVLRFSAVYITVMYACIYCAVTVCVYMLGMRVYAVRIRVNVGI